MSGDESEELPEGWATTSLAELVSPSSEKVEPEDCPESPYLSLEHIEPHTNRIVGQGFGADVHSTKAVFSAGDVLYGKLRPYLNKVAIPGFDGICSTDILVFRRVSHLDSRFLMLFLSRREVVDFANHNSAGVQLPRISFKELGTLEVALPPLAEQRRIVAAVEGVLTKVSSARERLERVAVTMKRFRQAVLAAACSGRLTADWREGGDESHQPNDEMPEVPRTWSYQSAAEVVESGTVISYGIVLPGPNLAEGVPYVRGQDITDSGQILVGQLWRTSESIADKHKRSVLAEGDVLLCVIRHLRVAVVPEGLDGANLTQGTVRLRPSKMIDKWFLAFFLQSPQAQDWMKARYIGMAMPRINVEHARQVPVPLPPLVEQQEIIRRVSALLALADRFEERAASALKRVETLTQSVLAKAFRGELVPTEAELARRENRPYETASELLTRVAANTNGSPKQTKARKAKEKVAPSDGDALHFAE